MDEEEYEHRYKEYEALIKKKTDRELMESIALKLQAIELNFEQMEDEIIEDEEDDSMDGDNLKK